MKKIHQLSFRMQIFLSSLILVIFPTVLLSTINAISKTSTTLQNIILLLQQH